MTLSSASDSRDLVHSVPMGQDSRPGTESDLCIVMYGGGVTSYEASRRAIERFGRENTEIWFADTLTEDRDLYRFNRDVEKLLGIEITRFDQGKDIPHSQNPLSDTVGMKQLKGIGFLSRTEILYRFTRYMAH